MSTRRLSKKPPLQINANPISRQQGEPPIAYELFQHWIAADGNRSFAELAVEFEKKQLALQWRSSLIGIQKRDEA